MLDLLLRNWLHNAAKQKLYEAASQAARERMSQSGEPGPSEPEARTRPCDVGLVFALGSEAGGLEDRLDGVVNLQASEFKLKQGGLNGRHVVLVLSGAGREAAAKATRILIAGHQPQWVVAAGFASGMQPQLKRGDIVMADELCDTAGTRLSLDLKVPPEALAALPHVHVGRLLTVRRVVRLPAEKRSLAQEHQALACDLESLGVAEVCRQERVRCLAIRVIRDTVDDELPADVNHLVRQKSAAGMLGAAVGALVNRPAGIKELLKLKEDSLVFSDRLARFLEDVIAQLAPRP